jgi:hypothetical protein
MSKWRNRTKTSKRPLLTDGQDRFPHWDQLCSRIYQDKLATRRCPAVFGVLIAAEWGRIAPRASGLAEITRHRP